jgi:hypothetical protein
MVMGVKEKKGVRKGVRKEERNSKKSGKWYCSVV